MSIARPRRVLTVIPTLGSGGAERQIANLVGASEGSGIEHVVVQLGGPSDFADAVRASGGRVIDLGLGGGRHWVSSAARLAGVLRRERPDVVKTDLFDANLATVVARLVTGRVPLVTTLHNLDYEPATITAAALPRRRVEVLRRLDRIAVRAGATYVACSHAVAASAARHIGVPAARLRVIYNSVDLDAFDAPSTAADRVRTDLAIPAGAPLLVTVGRLDPQKGQDVLLDAMADLVRVHPSTYLVLLGDGPLRGALEARVADLGIGDRVRFAGVRRDVAAVLAAADVFVLPSWFEGFPVSLVEAMAAGRAIVASAIGPVEEAVGTDALLVPPGARSALFDALSALVEDPERRVALGAAARARADRFRTGAIAAEWHALFHELAAGGAATGAGTPGTLAG